MADFQGKENFVTKSPRSPNVLKPKPLCFRKKPRRLISSPLGALSVNISSSASLLGNNSSLTCINPFRICNTENKRKRDFEVTECSEESILLRQTEDKAPQPENQKNARNSVSDIPVCVDENANLGFGSHHFQLNLRQTEVLHKKEKQLPVDWSLKTKIRLTSEKPFPWRNNFKTSEEASGTTGFVRCLHSENQKGSSCGLDSSYGAKFYQQCLVWMHPLIPWMNLFPREDNRMLTANSLAPPLNSYQQEILHSNWCDSFRSLYQLVRTCQCPFFYLCASAFTVMFRAGGVGSVVNIHAAITPTTRGLRNALKEEGIEFTMPLHPGSEQDVIDEDEWSCVHDEASVNVDNNKTQTDDGGYPTVVTEEEEPGIWLESLGLSQEDFPSLNPNRNKLRKEHRKTVDHRPESLVYVEDSETQALVNFLLNYPACMSKIGPMAGVPPTLLSPVAFLGSTLHAHKIHQSKVFTAGKELFTVELNGPLLPNTIHSLCSLFNSTQDGDFSATLTPHPPTLAFTKLKPQTSLVPSAFATENLKDCGLPRPFITQICTDSASSSGGIGGITAEHHLFSLT